MERVEGFLSEFLPRVEREGGVKEILHGASPDGRGLTTIIVWESPDAARRYREGDLVREPMALEEELGLASTRDGFLVTQHLTDGR
jgi:hypothetical protein